MPSAFDIIKLLGTPARARAVLNQSWRKRAFDRIAKRILATPPLQPKGDSPIFLSLVCHNDVETYLLAIKSLYRAIGFGRVSIINDGSLDAADLRTLRHHVPGMEVFDLGAITLPACPRADFFWERLVKIVELSSQAYVIQIDADTLVTGPVPEIVECWHENRSFLLGTDSGRTILPAPDTAQMVRGWIETHGWAVLPVGVEAEATLDKLPDANQRLYVHASAGFAGFARGIFSMAALELFSTEMSELLGTNRWKERGTEQITSNYLLSNAPEAIVLPFPRYACFEPQLPETDDNVFLHFLGAYRYNRGVYQQKAGEFISTYFSED